MISANNAYIQGGRHLAVQSGQTSLILDNTINLQRTQGLSNLTSQNMTNNLRPEINWLPNLQFSSPELHNELKRISYFELFQDVPQISQLFSSEYIDLVKNLVAIQESLPRSTDTTNQDPESLVLEGLENFRNSGRLTNEAMVNQIFIDQESNLYGLKDTSTTVGQGVSFSDGHQKNIENESVINFNHTLSQLDSKSKLKSTKNSSTPKKNSWDSSENETKDYDQEKNNDNFTKNVVKFAIKGLNKMALSLSKFV